MIQIKTILAPTDFSTYSDQALNYAAEIATSMKAKLYVIHVVEHANVGGDPEAHRLLIPEYIAEVEKAQRAKLQRVTEDLCSRGIDAHPILLAGRAYADIVQKARELEIDLIVLATHGRTGFSHLVFGSTAEKVVRLATCPVLTVKSHPITAAA